MALLRLFFLLMLAPVLAVRAVRLRRATPRLPGAGAGVPLRIAVLGESTVGGAGAATHAQALTGRLADVLAEGGREVRWQAVRRRGATAREVRRELVPRLWPADLLVVVLGVNDSLALRSAGRFRRDLLGIVVDARRRIGAGPVMLAGAAPFGKIPRVAEAVAGRAGWSLERARPGGARAGSITQSDTHSVPGGAPASRAVRRRSVSPRSARLSGMGRGACGGLTASYFPSAFGGSWLSI
ncbi:SGNH/GDSL hydrolase family protein [Amycolatopsis panacis]|uniref:SGNH/GDSL hydrolase family protein n=1 Tax=Amycolatopsis panacis TaxID=2340917 RepID=UPI0026D2E2CB|nr:SGNH/GDSL hydrolase family protein [Amycolatopsis panacis]